MITISTNCMSSIFFSVAESERGSLVENNPTDWNERKVQKKQTISVTDWWKNDNSPKRINLL